MNRATLIQEAAKTVELSAEQLDKLLGALTETIGDCLAKGESVSVDKLGKFYTVKYPGEVVKGEDGKSSTITLPTVEPEFDVDDVLATSVLKQMKSHPELFATDHEEEDPDEDDEAKAAPVEKKADGLPAMSPAVQPAKEKEKPLARASNIQYVDLSTLKVDREILTLVPLHLARQLSAAPIDLQEGVLTLAMTDPEDFDGLQIIRKETGLTIKPVLVTKDDLQLVLDQYTGLQAEVQEVIENSDLGISAKEIEQAAQEDLDQTNDNAPTAKIVHSLLTRAVKERASDIHIEPYEHKVVVRFRIDGVLVKRVELPKEIQSAVISRLKIMANLKIDEQRLPQDGRLAITYDKRQIDFRFSTIPVVNGEKVVMRILDKSVGIIDLEEVGLIDHGLEVLKKNSQRSHGMILVTGPTGSGKTTSLYAVLGRMMNDDVNILTLEDPVEYRIESINQSQVHADIGYTFAAGLRAVVRQDPDIVMLGEIRDAETADMAIHVALTGHVVLSTLHTNDAAGAFPRLIDMGIEPFLLTSSVHTVIAQRLARKVCKDCIEKADIPEVELEEVRGHIAKMPKEVRDELKDKKLEFMRGKGCDICGGKGYKGRVGIFEVLDVTEKVRDLVLKRSSNTTITEVAIEEGMVTMIQDGIIKALRGMTSLEEVWRVTRE